LLRSRSCRRSRSGIDGIHNVSADALAGLESAKDRNSEIAESFGESWKQTLQLAAHAEGDEVSAQDATAQIHWQDTTARSLAQSVDALGKMAADARHVPKRALWGRVPGVTQTDVQEWSRLADQQDVVGSVAADVSALRLNRAGCRLRGQPASPSSAPLPSSLTRLPDVVALHSSTRADQIALRAAMLQTLIGCGRRCGPNSSTGRSRTWALSVGQLVIAVVPCRRAG
jgi:hypothetical protein